MISFIFLHEMKKKMKKKQKKNFNRIFNEALHNIYIKFEANDGSYRFSVTFIHVCVIIIIFMSRHNMQLMVRLLHFTYEIRNLSAQINAVIDNNYESVSFKVFRVQKALCLY